MGSLARCPASGTSRAARLRGVGEWARMLGASGPAPNGPRALKRRVVVGVRGVGVGGSEELCRWDWLGRLRYICIAYGL